MQALNSLPGTLDEMYQSVIERCDHPGSLVRLICWIYFAQRPLSIRELLHTVSWDLYATAPLTDQDLPSEEQLLSACGGMVEIRKKERWVRKGLDYIREDLSEVIFTRGLFIVVRFCR